MRVISLASALGACARAPSLVAAQTASRPRVLGGLVGPGAASADHAVRRHL